MIPYTKQLCCNYVRWSPLLFNINNPIHIRQQLFQTQPPKKHSETLPVFKIFGCVAGFSLISFLSLKYIKEKNENAITCASAEKQKHDPVGEHIPSLPEYTMEEVAKHNEKPQKVWVTYKRGVYDITSFIDQHPGGDAITLAAGGSIEPFWLLYAAHNDSAVLALLETMRIGNLSAEEVHSATNDMYDPYADEPRRHPVLKPRSTKPFNAEPPPSLLVDSFVTPSEIFYVRNHLPVPIVDPKTYTLDVEIDGSDKKLSLDLQALKKYPKRTITATVMCAGNRRSEMTEVKPVKGLDWGTAALGNAKWSGVFLRDVLHDLGIEDDENKLRHVQFEGLDTDPTNNPYGASIPLWKALDRRGEVLLAYEMNGKPISRDHGYPVRVIVPGVVGARNVKWLGRIIVSKDESTSHWQQNDYKGFSPSTDWDTVDFKKAPAIQELPVISAICSPQPNAEVIVQDGFINIKGYAWSGGGQKIVRVDVTIDEGNTWHVATFDHQDEAEAPTHWAWTLWSVRVPVSSGLKNVEIWAKAVDSSYNTQPETFKNIWNLRGVLSNAYHRVPINLKYKK